MTKSNGRFGGASLFNIQTLKLEALADPKRRNYLIIDML
jgi:hypothetical protein